MIESLGYEEAYLVRSVPARAARGGRHIGAAD